MGLLGISREPINGLKARTWGVSWTIGNSVNVAVQIAENGNATYTLRWQMPGGSEVVGSWNTTGPSAGIYIPLIPSINNGKDDEKKVKKPIVKDLDVNIDNLIKILGSKIYPKPELSQNITQPRVSLEGKEATVTGEDSIVIYGPRVFKVMEDAYLKEGAAIFADNRVPQAQVLEDKDVYLPLEDLNLSQLESIGSLSLLGADARYEGGIKYVWENGTKTAVDDEKMLTGKYSETEVYLENAKYYLGNTEIKGNTLILVENGWPVGIVIPGNAMIERSKEDSVGIGPVFVDGRRKELTEDDINNIIINKNGNLYAFMVDELNENNQFLLKKDGLGNNVYRYEIRGYNKDNEIIKGIWEVGKKGAEIIPEVR